MKLLTLILSFFVAANVAAQQLNPEDLVRKVTEDVLSSIQSDKQLQAGDKKKALALAEQKILPHVDFRAAIEMASGRFWKTATPEQQEQLTTEFRAMLIRIYSNAIDVYRGQTMKVMPVHMAPNATETVVRNQYMKLGQRPVLVEYAMHKTPEGWKIYDITVEGISLVLNFRSDFEQVVRTAGIDGLIKRLQEKNA